MLDKVKTVVNSWYFGIAATGILGMMAWAYGYKLYAGLAFGWAACKAWEYLTGKKKKRTSVLFLCFPYMYL